MRTKPAVSLLLSHLVLVACQGGSVGEESGSESSADDSTTGMTSAPTTGQPSTTDPTSEGTSANPDSSGGDSVGTTDGGGCPQDVDFGAIDISGCTPLATDYTPGADDDYDACVSDAGEWVLVSDPPSSAARTEAYEEIVALLRGASTPTQEDFTTARGIYATDNGIESRVLRREDLHFPPIPPEAQDDTVAFDRQCTVGTNATDYPDRCVGPAKIQPIVDAAFAAGMTGDGDPVVHAARIDAALSWFFYVSIYKESASCILAPGDCDSHWAYYNGAVTAEEGIGLAADLRAIDPAIDDAIWNGMLAIRCWRDLFPADADPSFEDLGTEGAELFYQAHEQLDNAAWHGWARLVRAYLEQQPAVCDSAADANWAFVQIAGPVLDVEAEARDATAAATLSALWSNDAPSVDDLQAGVDALDALFGCPQCSDCAVPQQWGY